MIVLENRETGEMRVIASGGRFTWPWRVLGSLAALEKAKKRAVYLANYPYRMCSSCHRKGVFEST